MRKREELREQLERRSKELHALATSEQAQRFPYWEQGGLEMVMQLLGPGELFAACTACQTAACSGVNLFG